jgi:CxxC motif-containing protein (DUF1111 family)
MSFKDFEEKVQDMRQAADAVACHWKTWATVGLGLAGLVIGAYLVLKIIY